MKVEKQQKKYAQYTPRNNHQTLHRQRLKQIELADESAAVSARAKHAALLQRASVEPNSLPLAQARYIDSKR